MGPRPYVTALAGILTSCPTLWYWFETPRWIWKKAGRATRVVCTLRADTGPYMCSHWYWEYTDMYSYLQVSSLNFKRLDACRFSQPYFPIWTFLYGVDLFTLFTFFSISSVSLPNARCFTQPSFCLLRLNALGICWSLCKVLQPVLERGIKMD